MISPLERQPSFPLNKLTHSVELFAAQTQLDPSERSFHSLVALSHELLHHIEACEYAGIPREDIQAALAPARTLQGRSPFVNRVQQWPRGYPGDFETVEYIVQQIPRTDPGTLEHLFEILALSTPIAQQHRNKVQIQAKAIGQTILRSTPENPARVLNIACGSCLDVASILGYLEPHSFHLVLNDSDPDALEAARQQLASLEPRLTLLPGNILHRLRTILREGPYDLIVIGGLMDYLPDHTATFLLKNLLERGLKPEGKLLFTNIATHNPYRVWMEYLADWPLIERDENAIRSLLATSNHEPDTLTLYREGTGLTLICEVQSTQSSA